MHKIILSVVACFMFAFSFLLISNASAALWTLEATPIAENSPWSGFTVVFNDEVNGETVTSWDIGNVKVGSFSGVTYNSITYSDIYDLAKMNLGNFDLVDTEGNANTKYLTLWEFKDATETIIWENKTIWSYSVTHSPVPVPATVWLLGSGLVGLVAFRRKQKG